MRNLCKIIQNYTLNGQIRSYMQNKFVHFIELGFMVRISIEFKTHSGRTKKKKCLNINIRALPIIHMFYVTNGFVYFVTIRNISCSSNSI